MTETAHAVHEGRQRLRFSAVLPAAGLGVRMGGRKPWMTIAGVPVLVHAIRRLRAVRGCAEVVLAAHADDIADIRSRAPQLGVTRVVEGGSCRQESVHNALLATDPALPLVLIHDAVRPLVRVAVVEAVAARAAQVGAAIAAARAVATIKQADEGGIITATPPRERLWMAQTPQGFRRDLILEAHERAAAEGFLGTDDASLVERLGRPVAIVPEGTDNIKVTIPQDIAIAEAILDWQKREGLQEAGG